MWTVCVAWIASGKLEADQKNPQSQSQGVDGYLAMRLSDDVNVSKRAHSESPQLATKSTPIESSPNKIKSARHNCCRYCRFCFCFFTRLVWELKKSKLEYGAKQKEISNQRWSQSRIETSIRDCWMIPASVMMECFEISIQRTAEVYRDHITISTLDTLIMALVLFLSLCMSKVHERGEQNPTFDPECCCVYTLHHVCTVEGHIKITPSVLTAVRVNELNEWITRQKSSTFTSVHLQGISVLIQITLKSP